MAKLTKLILKNNQKLAERQDNLRFTTLKRPQRVFSAAALAFWQGDCSIKEGTTGTNAGCRIALTMLVKEPSGCAQGGPFISMAQNSPVTGIIEEQAVIIDFGKYEGMTVSDIAKLDPDFYNRLATDKEGFAIRRHRDKTFRLYVNPLSKMDN